MDFVVPKYHKNRSAQQVLPTYNEICIPRIENQISLTYIREKLSSFGNILHIQEIALYNDPNYKRVRFSILWNSTTEKVQKMVQRLQEGKNIKLIYQEPWFWKMVMDRR
jgi:hypothetical protein